MNVIDLRDELYKRRIQIIEVGDGCVYYAEEIDEGSEQSVFIFSYDFDSECERVLSYFTLDDVDYIEHFYPFGDSIIVLFENGGSSAWVIKLDKKSGDEHYRKKVSLIGRFFDCVPLDDDDIIIYTRADDDSRELFNRCLETTNSETLANLYDLKRGFRYFIKDFKTAALIENGACEFTTGSGEEKLLLSDPYCDEREKEEIVRALDSDVSDIDSELRDNIWVISKKKLLGAIKSGTENVALRRAASAGVEGTVRFECVNGDRIIFRAKVYRSQLEQFFEMSSTNGRVRPICNVKQRSGGSDYYTDPADGAIYYITYSGGTVSLHGEVGSDAQITFPERAGDVLSCIEDRYIIAEKRTPEYTTAIYDSRIGTTDTFEARARVCGTTVVLY